MKTAIEYLRTHRDTAVANLVELLRIPSESGDPMYAADVEHANFWLRAHFAAAGFDDVRRLDTPGLPAVSPPRPPTTPPRRRC